jgi:serine/threonine protein phosphatase PrpC
LRFETAEVSLLGDRDENQDRAAVQVADRGVLLIVADGMGGHAGGALAAETAVDSLITNVSAADPETDSRAILRAALEAAHDAVVAAGEDTGLGSRPRSTCAVCMVSDGLAAWAHVGDTRVYHVRPHELVTRTRDHTPIESLLQDGLISEEEVAGHPMRHYVEYCLGGVAERPLITVSELAELAPGDLLIVCSDGLWATISDAELAAGPGDDSSLQDWLTRLAGRAVRLGTPYSDNTTAVALRALAD